MADYGLKYLCEYRSKMRGKLLYRIEIAEKGAPGLSDSEAGMVRPYSEVFSIKWGNSDDAEYAAVKGSSMTLRILCVNDLEYLSLFRPTRSASESPSTSIGTRQAAARPFSRCCGAGFSRPRATRSPLRALPMS